MPTTTSSTKAEAGLASRLTPPGVAALAVVRLVGTGVDAFLGKHFQGRPAPGRCAYGKIVAQDGQSIDDVIVVRLPDSGQPAADITLHGGAYIVDSFLALAASRGFAVSDRISPPVPLEAADGATIIDRELAAHLPLAMTELAVEILTAQPDNWLTLQHDTNAGAANTDRLRAILHDRALWRLLHPPRIAIIGVPNAGKSTLANTLFAQQRSLTADLPGTTRDWVGGLADLTGLAVHLIDTPGLRASVDSIEAEAIRRAQRVLRRAHALLLLLDPTQPAAPQEALIRRYPAALLVSNKTDRPAQWQPPTPAIKIVATTGDGIDALRTALRRKLGCDELDPWTPRWWTRRQRRWLIEQISSPHPPGQRGLPPPNPD